MKRLLPLLLALLLLCGCTVEEDAPSALSEPNGEISSETPLPPDAPPALPVEDAEPEPEPLEEVALTPEEAAAILTPDGNGVYRIETKMDLVAFAALVGAGGGEAFDGLILNDIDLSGLNFTPIGTEESPYRGSFDGGGNILRGLTVRGDADFAGLFGVVAPDGMVEDTHVIGGEISGRNMVGGIAGQCKGSLSACSFRGVITATGGAVGGICGQLGREAVDFPAGTMDQCGANVELTGNQLVGGLTGSAVVESAISNCYARGSVAAGKGEQEEPSMVGGLVGYAGGTIKHCFTSLELYTHVASRTVGAFVGAFDGEFISCYYNMEPVENWKSVGDSADEEIPGLKACTVEEITEISTFENWNFVTVWSIEETQNRGLPYLRVFMD